MTWFDQNIPAGSFAAPRTGTAAPTTAAPTTGAPAAGAPAPTNDPQQAIRQILGRYPASSAGLEQAMPEIQRLYPGTRFDTSSGPRDEIVIPGYGLVDVLTNAEGGGTPAWSWQRANAAGGGSGQAYAPYAGTFTGGGKYPLASVMGDGFMRPWDTPFKAPTMAEVQKTPGYQTRLDAGRQAIERSAASHGTLLTGGTLKDLTQFGQDYGAEQYNNEYARRLGEYQQAYGIYNNNGQTQYSRISDQANRGAQAASAGAGQNSQYAQGAGGYMADIGNAQAGAAAASGAAYGGAVSNIGNNVSQMYMLSQFLKRPPVPGGGAMG